MYIVITANYLYIYIFQKNNAFLINIFFFTFLYNIIQNSLYQAHKIENINNIQCKLQKKINQHFLYLHVSFQKIVII